MVTLADISREIPIAEIRGAPKAAPATAEKQAAAFCALAPPDTEGRTVHSWKVGPRPEQLHTCRHCGEERVYKLNVGGNNWIVRNDGTPGGAVLRPKTRLLRERLVAMEVGETIQADHDWLRCLMRPGSQSLDRCGLRTQFVALKQIDGTLDWVCHHTANGIATATRLS